MNRRQFITAASATLAASALPSCKSSANQKTLTVFTWADYLSDEAKAGFEKKHGCTLVIDTFDSNEAMLAKLESGAGGYDILVPSSYAVTALKRKNLLQPLDHAKLKNLGNVDTDYLAKAADPAMEFSVPYMMAPTCLSYLSSKVSDPVESWSMLDRTDLAGRVTLLDDMREVLGAGLKFLGHSLNSTDPAELAAARDVAIRWKKNIAKFENEQYKTGIASGEFFLVQGYAGDLIQAREENEDMRIFIPKEGSTFSCDDLCIPKDAKQVDLAHAFIDYLTGADVAAENMEWIGYRAPNSAAYPKLSEEFRGIPVLFPPIEIFNACEAIADLGDQLPLWTSEWDKVKSA
ncbi:spermidine/putrescine ABC transporter substrate-binding protein [Luteolibacter pohnpeiensis]|uniref:Spermidine/putrescine ABC transporter substrate-binding protein n=1 Tax=Luteolibacter pohnpeiensis TaxID=454153 RepID=A0A934VWE6_9BACT|nr:spermidine/putrescine ABC transporter substrate-binding protein [Luteolibacter pohnpeiensis]MBK1882743.1 spermidine/putrescine ABC transporter substrate-binding protein [Luteolibacter pohnpeiensis]